MGLTESRARLKEGLRTKSWDELEGQMAVWFEDFKIWEKQETFDRAFRDKRMTLRVRNPQAHTSPPKIDKVTFDKRTGVMTKLENKTIEAPLLDRTIGGILSRVNPANFYNSKEPTVRSKKIELGLGELPGTLLDPDVGIAEQAKGYFDRETQGIFMPLPLPEDHELFYTLIEMAKDELKTNSGAVRIIREMRSKFTRIKLAQATDMGTGWVKLDKGDGQDHYRYGYYGLEPIPGEKIRKRVVTAPELKARFDNALKYKTILAGEAGHNEIVIAYRQHGKPDEFPMFVQWLIKDPNQAEKKFPVITAAGDKTGKVLLNNGKFE